VFLLDWLRTGVSWILVQFHQVLDAIGMDPESGWTWAFSIVGLVIVIRILLIPLFVKQIKAQRNMQLVHPKIKEIQQKYKGDRERISQETMKVYREEGANPLSSCLPILLQMPIFFALFSVLQGIATNTPQGVFKWPQYEALFEQARQAAIFNAPLYGTFLGADEVAADGFSPVATRVVTFVLIIAMVSTTFTTQRQLIMKNMSPDNAMVKQQKILLYVFPVMFGVGGINFPIGVLIYWFSTNLWSMGQQFYVIRNNPQPNTPAHAALEARKKEKAAKKAVRRGEAESVEEVLQADEPSPTQRSQPKKQSRSKRKRGPGSSGGGPGPQGSGK
jgi:YidC/Oxa1 family membrane protein insertase